MSPASRVWAGDGDDGELPFEFDDEFPEDEEYPVPRPPQRTDAPEFGPWLLRFVEDVDRREGPPNPRWCRHHVACALDGWGLEGVTCPCAACRRLGTP